MKEKKEHPAQQSYYHINYEIFADPESRTGGEG